MCMLPQLTTHLREQTAQEALEVRWGVQLLDKARAFPLKSKSTLIIGDIRRSENLQQFLDVSNLMIVLFEY